jgi:DNA repair protein RecN (Recombination protein N)
MLRTLTIRDFVIVDALELDFSRGFTVFSGETGAGKSILIDALALALGERADASVVREGAARADITAEFAPPAEARRWLSDAEMTEAEGLILRRVVDSQGRSKSWINGFAATLTQMRELGEMLVDIHGQHAHQRLLRAQEQRALLDEQAGLGPLLETVAQAFRRWQMLSEQCLRFEANAKELLQERQHLDWQAEELQRLAVAPGEWVEISQEHQRLAHAAALIEGARGALDSLAESESAILDHLGAIQHRVAQLAAIDAALASPAEELESARIQIQEAVHGLTGYLDRIELDPERLAVLEARMEAIHAASRKFRLAPDELPGLLASVTERLGALGAASDIETLRKEEQAQRLVFEKEARALSAARTKTARALEAAVTEGMQSLSMPGGRLEIVLEPSEPSAHGLETVEFHVATHPGATPRPLARIASGGELARISLALSVVASTSKTVPTLIFDEVDSGIGGAVAEVVGRLLRQLGHQCQVLCVTHLAQVAAQAEHHFAVNKTSSGGRTSSQINALAGGARVDELARMLGGIEITPTTRKHARELLAAVS